MSWLWRGESGWCHARSAMLFQRRLWIPTACVQHRGLPSTRRWPSSCPVEAAIRSTGPSTDYQRLEMTTAEGIARPRLKGAWFPDGFHGTMAELLSAIAEKREPSNSARNNLASLSLCFAAVASAERGEAVRPGSVRQLHSEPS